MTPPDFPSMKLRLALFAYGLLWWVMMPVILLYLHKRGRKDPLYAQHIGERFGRYAKGVENPVWVHAVSLGEMRSATPLIRALLANGETVLTPHFTPAGRREAAREVARAHASDDAFNICAGVAGFGPHLAGWRF